MIGHYLGTLTEEQEDRVLTTAMRTGFYDAPCLVGAALTPAVAHSQFHDGYQVGGLLRVPPRVLRNLHEPLGGSSVEMRFDTLVRRFGCERVTAAIRNRILSNRARRVLASREAAVGLEASTR